MTKPHLLEGAEGDRYPLGTISMRLLADAPRTGGVFALAEFSGGEGAWTVPHIHRQTEESFYVLDGRFTFTLGEEEREVGPGGFIVVPRGKRHLMRAGTDGGRLLTLWTPGGAEAMFIELSGMPADSLRDPDVRRALSARFDSVPVT
ncbi:MAG TPA: cupin domain-containing protein [Candidatus Limnocylindrales bacterium]|nr:cupin domain-containing protein [Candidatus Limnocylindrales bacterium]